MKLSYILAIAGIIVVGLIIRAYRNNCKFHDCMKKSDYSIDFTKKKL